MKLIAALILEYPHESGSPRILTNAFNLDSFGYFQRGPVKQFCVFFSKTLIERVQVGRYESVAEGEHVCHVHRRSNIGAVAIGDSEYPPRVAFGMLNKLMDEYQEEFHGCWTTVPDPVDEKLPFNTIDIVLKKYQDPSEADSLTKVQKDLDETKTRTIDQVLQRGEKLDDLVEKTGDLSGQSKTFYKSAKKMNSCCVIL